LIMVRFSELAGTRIKRLANARRRISGGIEEFHRCPPQSVR